MGNKYNEIMQSVRDKRFQQDVEKVDDEYLRRFSESAGSYLKSAQKQYEGLGYGNAYQSYLNRRDSYTDLDYRRRVIQEWSKRNPGRLTQQDTDFLDSFGRDSKGILDAFTDARDYFSQFATAEDYEKSLYRPMTKEEAAQGEAEMRTKLDEYRRSGRGKADAEAAAGDALGSLRFDPANLDLQLMQLPGMGLNQEELGYQRAIDYYIQQGKFAQDREIMEADVQEITAMGKEWEDIFDSLLVGMYDPDNPNAVSNAVELRKQLYAKFGQKRAEELAESWMRYRNQEGSEEMRQYAQENADSGFFGKVAASGASVFANAMGTLAAPAGYLIEAGNRTGRYQTLDPNNPGALAGQYASTVRGEIAKDIEGEEPGAVRKALSYGYQGVMSAADNLVRLAMGGGTKFGSLGLAAVGSFGSTLSEASSKGASPGQAVLMGVSTAALELLTEKYSIDNLFEAAENGAESVVDILKAAFRQAGVEASEEELSFLGGLAAEALILREKSGYRQQIGELVAQGYSGEEAKQMADMAIWNEALDTAITSAISGGVMTGGPGAVNYGLAARDAKRQYGSKQGELVAEGLKNPVDSDSYILAEKYQGRLDQGKNLSGAQLNRLIKANEKQEAKTVGEESATTGEDSAAVQTVTLEEAAQKYGAQAQAMIHTYTQGQDVTKFDTAYQAAYDMGKSGVKLDYVKNSQSVKYLTEQQVENAYQAGKEAVGGMEVSETGSYQLKDSGETVTIRGISSMEGGMKLSLEDGRTVDASNVQFATSEESTVYQAVAGLDLDTQTAQTLVDGYDPGGKVSALDYSIGIKQAFRYGEKNLPAADMLRSKYISKLTAGQRTAAYEAGQTSGQTKAEASQKAVAGKEKTGGDGGVRFIQGGNVTDLRAHLRESGKTLNATQETAIRAMEQLSAALGVDMYVYESYENSRKQRVYLAEDGEEAPAPNGKYYQGGKLYIDLNAGVGGKGTMLYTVAHELTHFIREWSPEKFKILADVLMEGYAYEGRSVSELVEDQIRKARKNGRTIDFDTAFEEVVADSMENVLTSGNVVQMMAELKQQDKTLWQKIRDWFRELAEDIRALMEAYKDHRPDSAEGQMVAQMQEVLPVLEQFYADALADASENYKAAPKAEKNTTQEGDVKYQARRLTEEDLSAYLRAGTRANKSKVSALKAGQQIILTSAYQIKQFINNAIDKKLGNNTTVAYGKVNDRLADDVLAASDGNIKIKDNYLELIPDNLQHAYEQHHSAKKDGDIDLDRSDFENIPEYLDSYTEVVYAIEYASGKVGVCVSKRLANGRILLIETVSKSRGALQFKNAIGVSESKYQSDYVSVYKKRAGTNTRGSNSSNNSLHDGSNSKNSIRNSEPEVKEKFSDRDSSGNALSQEQQEFFKDSKVRDEQGRLMVMYHGTPNGNHTTFRPGTYFTPDRQYADVYQNPGASMLSAKKNVDNPKTYEAYLNIRKPFDTRKPKERRIFMQEYYRQWGTGAPLADSGLPDWTDGMDLQEFIEEMGYDYDGLILDEGATGGYGLEVKSRGLSYVVFSSEQVKDVTNKKPTNDPDIYLSDRDPGVEEVHKRLEKENGKLREDVEYLKEMLRLQKTGTQGKKFTRSSVDAAAGLLMKQTDSQGTKKELAGLLNSLYEHIAGSEELTWESVKEAAQPAVDWLRTHKRQNKKLDGFAQEVLKDIRGSKVHLSETQYQEAAYISGSFNDFRKSLMGNVTVTKSGGISLDEQWQEWASMYPSVFDPNISASDMPRALTEAIQTLRGMRSSEYAYGMLDEQELLRMVYDSYWNVSTLYTVADARQKEITWLKNEHTKRMTKLREDHKNATAQLKKEHEADLEAVRQAMRDEAEKQRKDIQAKHEASRKKTAENRRKAEMRRKIRRTVMDLDKLLNKGDKKRNVKEGMQDLVSEALRSADILFTENYSNEDMIRNGVGTDLTEQESRYMQEAREILEQMENLPSGSYEAFEARQETEAQLKSKLGYRMARLQDVFARERARLNRTKISEVLNSLADAYASLQNSEQSYVSEGYHENVYQYLLMLKGDVGGTTVKDMTLNQLEELHKAYTMVLTTVRNANKMFAANMKQTREQLGNKAIAEVQAAGGEHGLWAPGEDKISAFSWNNLKPVYAFERIGSETLTRLFENTRAGEDGWARDMTEARAFYLDQIRKHKYDSWNFDRQYKFTSSSGVNFSLNLEQIMSLYAYSKREQAHDHLLKGGFVFDSNTEVQVNKMGVKLTYLNKTAKAHNVSQDILADIISQLTDEQKAFVDEMQDYLSTTMGGKGNEVSLQLYGVKLFNEKHYFPLRSAGQYMERAKEADLKKQQGQISIVNSGFTKATTPKSSNPVVLSGFMDVWADHVNEMSMYHSFVLPMEDFRRVYNYSSPNVEEGQSISVNSVIQDAYGEAATGYIDQLYRDLNGGAVSDPRETPAKALMGKFKKAAVFASLSVVVQQPSAIGRAFAIIDPKYFIGAKVDSKRHKQLWAELKQYAPVATIKEMGYFDTGMGKSAQDFIQAKEYKTLKEKAAALFTDADYRDEVLGKMPALADELTWCAIWEAAKRETKAKNPGMNVKSEDFLQLAAKRFTEVVTKTQVYDSVLSRSANMRSKGAFMSMWTAFMAEPTTTINMVEDALRKAKKGNKQYAARAMGAVMTSVVINSLLSSLVYAMRDDDEDETFLEKYVQSVATEILDGINPITYYPFLKDVWSVMQGYDIERSDMSLITSLVEKITKLVKVYSKDTETMDEEELAEHNKSLANAWWGVTDYLTALLGIPVKNVRRDINGAVNMFSTISRDLTDRDTSWGSLIDKTLEDVKNAIPVVGWLPDATAADKLYQATVSGDTAYQKRLESVYSSQTSLDNAIRKGLRANDSRIWEAAMAWNNNDLEGYKRLAREIIDEGHFSQDNVVMAIQAEAKAMMPKESESAAAPKAKGYFNMDKFAVAIAQGNASMAAAIKDDIIDTAVRNGKSLTEAENSFASSVSSACKDLYLDGTMTQKQAVDALAVYGGYDKERAQVIVDKWRAERETGIAYDDIDDAFLDGKISAQEVRQMYMTYGGLSQEDAEEQVVRLSFVKKNPTLGDISYAAVRDYTEHCEQAGVAPKVFYDAWKYKNSLEGSVKEPMLEYINSLNLTPEQKDSLYFAFGWAESKLRSAPWH